MTRSKQQIFSRIRPEAINRVDNYSTDPIPYQKTQGTRLIPTAKMIDLSRLILDADQPRQQFLEETLRSLALSIHKDGILEPLTVEYVVELDRYRIVFGARRYKATLLANEMFPEKPITAVPCNVKENLSADQRIRFQLIENMQREDLTPVEKGRGLVRLKEVLHSDDPLGENSEAQDQATWQEVAHTTGIPVERIWQLVRLLKLPDYVQAAVVTGAPNPGEGKISEKVALALAPLREHPDLLRTIFEETAHSKTLVSAEQVAKRVQRLLQPSNSTRSRRTSNTGLQQTESKLSKIYGTPIRVVQKRKGGHFIIAFTNEKEFIRLCKLLQHARDVTSS